MAMTLEMRSKLFAWHPDVNGGDTSKVDKLVELLQSRVKLCKAGCGNVVKRKSKRRANDCCSVACSIKYKRENKLSI